MSGHYCYRSAQPDGMCPSCGHLRLAHRPTFGMSGSDDYPYVCLVCAYKSIHLATHQETVVKAGIRVCVGCERLGTRFLSVVSRTGFAPSGESAKTFLAAYWKTMEWPCNTAQIRASAESSTRWQGDQNLPYRTV